jgi:hypothetical protein
MKLVKKLSTLILIVVTSLTIVACSNDDNPADPDPQEGQVMAVHTSPNAPAVDILVNSVAVVEGLGFTENTGYLAVPAGSQNFKVYVPALDAVIFDQTLPVAPTTYFSVFAADSVEKIYFFITNDDLTNPAAGKAHVRFMHLSPNAPAVDITDTNGNIIFGNYEFSDYSDFTPIDVGTYDLQVRLQGTDTVVLPLNDIVLEDGKIYTVYAKGFVGGAGDQALGAEIIVNN